MTRERRRTLLATLIGAVVLVALLVNANGVVR